MRRTTSVKTAFTLIELLVVIAIIAILAAMRIVSYFATDLAVLPQKFSLNAEKKVAGGAMGIAPPLFLPPKNIPLTIVSFGWT